MHVKQARALAAIAAHAAVSDAHHTQAVVTKDFFVPVTTTRNGEMTYRGKVAVCILTDINQWAFTCFHMPHDFTAIVEAVLVVIPVSTQAAAEWSIATQYGSGGESYSAHLESDNTTTYNVSLGNYFEIDISGILTALAADDYVGIEVILRNAAHDVNVVGVRFKYS